jgi:hypothetical protein
MAKITSKTVILLAGAANILMMSGGLGPPGVPGGNAEEN